MGADVRMAEPRLRRVVTATVAGRHALACFNCRAPLFVLRPDQAQIMAMVRATTVVLTIDEAFRLSKREPVPAFENDLRVESLLKSTGIRYSRGGPRLWKTGDVIAWHFGHCPGCGRKYQAEPAQWEKLLGGLVLSAGF